VIHTSDGETFEDEVGHVFGHDLMADSTASTMPRQAPTEPANAFKSAEGSKVALIDVPPGEDVFLDADPRQNMFQDWGHSINTGDLSDKTPSKNIENRGDFDAFQKDNLMNNILGFRGSKVVNTLLNPMSETPGKLGTQLGVYDVIPAKERIHQETEERKNARTLAEFKRRESRMKEFGQDNIELKPVLDDKRLTVPR
jgi:hypothetical protein